MSHASEVINRGYLDNIVVTTKDGRQFDLGSPKSKLFRARVIIYKIRRKLNG